MEVENKLMYAVMNIRKY